MAPWYALALDHMRVPLRNRDYRGFTILELCAHASARARGEALGIIGQPGRCG